MKKVIVILSVFLLAGCTAYSSSTLTMERAIGSVIESGPKYTNTNGKGYKYYKPRDFSVLEEKDFNLVLLNNGYNFYFNVDLNGYYNSKSNNYKIDYVVDNEVYFSYRFSYNNIDGYISIRDAKNGYFYIKMLYNYSYIEVGVKEKDVKKAVIDSAIILSSINYNDKVIEKLIASRDLVSSESTYEIAKPKVENDRNILDVAEYDQYKE